MKDIYNEEWRAIKGFEGRYAVSNLGNVKSVERIVTSHNQHGTYQITVKEKILKPAKDKDGYLYVDLCKNGVGKKYLVHRLVALTFIPNPDPEKYDIVNHKIEGVENRSINTVDNLEWCDIPYNLNYGNCQERKAKAMTNGKLSKTVYQYTKNYELVGEYPSAMEAQRQTGFKQSNISACCNNRFNREGNNVYKGFIWSYTHL